MKKNPIKYFMITILSLLFIVAMFSCNKNSDLVETIVTKDAVLSTSKVIQGFNGGLTTDSKTSDLVSKGEDSLFLSQNPLVEYKYDIAIDYETINTYEIDTISNDTISVSSVTNEISRDTLSITAGPIWLPFDFKNEVSLKVGLKKEFLNPELKVNIAVNVVDDLGILFTQLLDGDTTWSTDEVAEIGNDIYTISTVIPRYNVNGKILNETDGIIIPRFGVREFYTGVDTVTRDFEIVITSTSGSVVVAPFSIKFVDNEIYQERQCWLSGNPDCADSFTE